MYLLKIYGVIYRKDYVLFQLFLITYIGILGLINWLLVFIKTQGVFFYAVLLSGIVLTLLMPLFVYIVICVEVKRLRAFSLHPLFCVIKFIIPINVFFTIFLCRSNRFERYWIRAYTLRGGCLLAYLGFERYCTKLGIFQCPAYREFQEIVEKYLTEDKRVEYVTGSLMRFAFEEENIEDINIFDGLDSANIDIDEFKRLAVYFGEILFNLRRTPKIGPGAKL